MNYQCAYFACFLSDGAMKSNDKWSILPSNKLIELPKTNHTRFKGDFKSHNTVTAIFIKKVKILKTF